MSDFFRTAKYSPTAHRRPKWHRIYRQVHGGGTAETQWLRKVTALCGYKLVYHRLGAEAVEFREEVRAEKRRCLNCEHEFHRLEARLVPRGDRYANQNGEGL